MRFGAYLSCKPVPALENSVISLNLIDNFDKICYAIIVNGKHALLKFLLGKGLFMENLKKIAITTDTNSGMLPHENEDQGIFVLPMPFVIDSVSLLESVDITREEFYQKLLSGSKVSTSQPSVTDVTEFWNKILEEYDEIVHIPTSSHLSNSCSTAQALSKEFDGKVTVVDNHRISVSLKSSVFDAVKLRDSGKTSAEIAKYLEDTGSDYCIYFSLESMEYLKRGGRISPAAAAIGSILKLRPVLHLGGETLDKFALPRTLVKAKDIMKNAIAKDLSEKFKKYVDDGEMRLVVVHGENKEDAEIFQAEIQKLFPSVPFLWDDPMSLSISCHTGPGTLAVGCIRVVK